MRTVTALSNAGNMFVADKLIYLQMQKTASTHIARVLRDVVGGEQHLQHQRLKIDPEGRLVVASIRSPWAWYVSLWSYGCRRGGGVSGIYHRLTAPPPPWSEGISRSIRHARAKREVPTEVIRAFRAERARQRSTRTDLWRPVYTHPDDVAAFRSWLRLVFDPDRAHELLEPFGRTDLRYHGGFMTFRYFWLLARDRAELERPENVSSTEAIRAYDATGTVHDDMIRIEHLDRELPRVLERAGYRFTEQEQRDLEARCRQKSNESPHLTVRDYYDDASLALVAEREAFLVAKYGYEEPA